MPLYYKKQQNENSNPDKQPQPPTTMDPGKLVYVYVAYHHILI